MNKFSLVKVPPSQYDGEKIVLSKEESVTLQRTNDGTRFGRLEITCNDFCLIARVLQGEAKMCCRGDLGIYRENSKPQPLYPGDTIFLDVTFRVEEHL